jgi:GNAT superfamily N-acetyltransferase
VTEPRLATADDAALAIDIAAQGFYEDPVMSWVFPDRSIRLGQLHVAFGSMVARMLGEGGGDGGAEGGGDGGAEGGATIHILEDACTSFWHRPFDPPAAHDPPADDAQAEAATARPAFPPDVLERLSLLGATMTAAHPQSPHWYLNVLSTLPEQQSRGLGARTLSPVLTICDEQVVPAYLESSNPRNIPFYRRQGFVVTGEIKVPGGPSLFPMWRDPAG